jgi:hypothetical protein
MSIRVGLFCEDSAHESCARALLEKFARELFVEVSVRTATATAGVGRLKQELRAFQTLIGSSPGVPDLLIVLIDANDVGPRARIDEINGVLNRSLFPDVVIGTPDPCVERWLLADPVSFTERFSVQPPLHPAKKREDWKRWLVAALEEANEIVMQGGAEFAEEIFEVMDFYRAGRIDPSMKSFVDELRAALRRFSSVQIDHGG